MAAEGWEEAARRYIAFQDDCPSPYHATAAIAARLREAGFSALSPRMAWELKAEGRYYTIHEEGKALAAFEIRASRPAESGFAILGSHVDSPAFHLRRKPWLTAHGCSRLATQTHGGMILRSWLDRPLILAGTVYTLSGQDDQGLPAVTQRLVRSAEPIGVIPDIAIHLDREKNDGVAINAEEALGLICGGTRTEDEMIRALSERLELSAETTLDGFDLVIAPFEPHRLVGFEGDMILGARHDDLAMAFAGLEALCAATGQNRGTKTPVAAFFDAEETGSLSAGGAQSSFLRDILERIEAGHPGATAGGGIATALASSFVVSADMAHALHPGYVGKHDENHRPLLNHGLVIKENTNDRYATSGLSATVFKGLCQAEEVPVQDFVIRQDLGCGSTIGPITAAKLGCPTVDVGTAMWGMHSAAETMGAKDLAHAIAVFRRFLS